MLDDFRLYEMLTGLLHSLSSFRLPSCCVAQSSEPLARCERAEVTRSFGGWRPGMGGSGEQVALGLEQAIEGVLSMVDPQRAVGERGAKGTQGTIGMPDVVGVLAGELEAKREEGGEEGGALVACRPLPIPSPPREIVRLEDAFGVRGAR